MSRLAALALLLSACSTKEPPPARAAPAAPAAPTEPAPVAPKRTPFALAPSIAKLPLAISGITAEHLSHYAAHPSTDSVGTLLGKDNYSFLDAKEAPCADALVDKIDGVYTASFHYPLEVPNARLIHGISAEELVKCVINLGGKRTKSTNARITQVDWNVFTQLDGWILWTSATDGIDALLATESTTSNPLGAVLAQRPQTKLWFASAMDYAWEPLAIRSHGAIVEYEQLFDAGPVTLRFLFADAASAKLARDRMKKLPDTLVTRTAMGEVIEKELALIHSRGAITIEDRELVVRGSAQQRDWMEGSLQGLYTFGIPVRRPLTELEKSRILRPIAD